MKSLQQRPDLLDSETAAKPVLFESQSKTANSSQMASPADFYSSAFSISSSPSDGQVTHHLSAASSTQFQGTAPLTVTESAINPTLSPHQRPDTTYNLQESSHNPRLASKDLSGTLQRVSQESGLKDGPCIPLDSDRKKLGPAANGHAQQHQQQQQTSSESQPAKRQRIKEDKDSPKSLGQGHLWNSALQPEGSPSFTASVNQELISYVWPILLAGGVTDPSELLSLPFFKPFTCLQRKRDVEWNPTTNCAQWSFRTKIDAVALLVQLTGDHSPKCCARCDPEMGLFKGCIVTTSATLLQNYYGCANCLYHGRQTFCSLKGWRNRQSRTVDLIYEHSLPNSVAKPARQHGEASNSTITNTERKQTATLPGAGDSWSAYTRPSNSITPELSLTAAERRIETSSEPNEILSMERWERAPGRIRSQASESPENIAFSKSYLATGAEVQVCREAAFRIEIIRSGHTHQIKAEDNIVRICSVASAGKLSVKMDGEEPLVIGPHGMFTVRPRSACIVESEIYDDVALHITTVKTG